ncbi:chemotaxis protein CheX [uncultured Paludibaculum sp.]|uniref:chemotaxis protein CheX n=1 Tax=uncultured Paludibaculum sp. TaxID=1765020 RepID=UPI002AABA9DA|nr:chemotaxis protein CheX [uncultured Paludibaculum sp.]
MTTQPTTCSVEVNELQQIVASVFQLMMGLDVEPIELPWSPEPGRLAAAIDMKGSWNGAIMLETSSSHACRLTGLFLAMDPPCEVDAEVHDVLGEITNMIGGNYKCALAPGATISIPSVTTAGDRLPSLSSQNASRLAFSCADDVFWVVRVPAA